MKPLKKTLKQLAVVVMVLTITIPVKGQWLPNGTHIYNTNTGNVGIGTATPQEKFHVKGNVGIGEVIDALTPGVHLEYIDGGSGELRFRGYRWGEIFSWGHGASGLSWVPQMVLTNNVLQLYNSQSAPGSITVQLNPAGNTFFTGGNVGIGTTVPGGILHVQKYGDVSTTVGSAPGALRLEGSGGFNWASGEAASELLFMKDGDIVAAIRAEHDRNGGDHSYEDAGISFYTGSVADVPVLTRAMHIGSGQYGGNVGIGTTSPGGKLHVSGIGVVDDLVLQKDLDASRNWINFRQGTTSRDWRIGMTNAFQNPYDLVFYNANGIASTASSPGTPFVIFTQTGNVGIGTTTVTEKLTVNGKILAEEVQVVLDVPDYVFAKEYKLKTLSEVSKFINEHKHLPEVPSEKEVMNNGGQVSLGEMNMTLLKKIEELTLYAIDQDETIKSLLKRVTELEKQ